MFYILRLLPRYIFYSPRFFFEDPMTCNYPQGSVHLSFVSLLYDLPYGYDQGRVSYDRQTDVLY